MTTQAEERRKATWTRVALACWVAGLVLVVLGLVAATLGWWPVVAVVVPVGLVALGVGGYSPFATLMFRGIETVMVTGPQQKRMEEEIARHARQPRSTR